MTVIASGLERKYPDSNRDLGVRLVPLQEDMVGKFRPALLMLMGSAAFVLLIACSNIGTLLLARAAGRLEIFSGPRGRKSLISGREKEPLLGVWKLSVLQTLGKATRAANLPLTSWSRCAWLCRKFR